MDNDTRNEVEKALSKMSDRILRGLFFRKDGGLNWFGYIALVIIVLFATAILSFFSGCVNLYTRCPTTNARIERVYQSTSTAAGMSIIIAFPQVMSDSPSRSSSFYFANLFTIPIGCLGMCDALCEGCIDTILYPCDYALSRSRRLKIKTNTTNQTTEDSK